MRQDKSFAARLKESLKRCGTSQAGLARLAEVDQSSISRYLRGQCEPNLRQFRAIALALGLKPAELLPDEPLADPVHHAVKHENDHVYMIFRSGLFLGEWRGATLDCFINPDFVDQRAAPLLPAACMHTPPWQGR